MKSKLLLVAIFSLLSTQVEAQGFVQKIGNFVGRQVVRKIAEGNENKSAQNTDKVLAAETPATQKEQPTAQQTPQTALGKDMGQNIPREAGLDYIDEYGINHGGGILIDSVLWAPVNCGYHATDYPYGKLYQWGRPHGQGYGAPYEFESANVNPDKTTAEVVPAPITPAEARKYPKRFYAMSNMALFNWTRNDLSLWNKTIESGIITKNSINDPCPEGWRLPDLFDIYCLIQHHSKVVESPEGGIKGMWFSGSKEYSAAVPRIFLPLAGYRTQKGESGARNKVAEYWTLRHGGGEGLVWHLYIAGSTVKATPHAYPHEAFSVRCVKDVKGQRLR